MSVGRIAQFPEGFPVPFLAVCPDCLYSQVCVLPKSSFPRMKCCRCRQIYDPVGSEDTEIIPDLAGATIATRVRARRAKRTMSARRRRRKKSTRRVSRRAAEPVLVAGIPSAETIAAAVLSPPEPELAPAGPSASGTAETRPHADTSSTVPAPESTAPASAVPILAPIPRRPRPKKTKVAELARPLTRGALFLLCGALLAAPISVLAFLVHPFAIISLLIGLAAVRAAIREGEPVRFPAAVTGTAAAVVLAAFFVPSLLGPTFDRPGTPTWAAGDVQVVPHPRFAAVPDLRTAEWVDASKATLQQGATRVEIVDARFGKEPAGGRDALLVRVRLHRLPGLPVPPVAWKEDARATLWDSAGKQCEPLSVQANASSGDPRTQAEEGGRAANDTVLSFSIPVLTRTPLRLELPAVAWGGTGTFKFAIPPTMVKR